MSQRRYGILALALLLFCVLLYQAASVELPDTTSEKCSGWRLSAHLQERSEALIQAGRELQPILTQGEIRRGAGCVRDAAQTASAAGFCIHTSVSGLAASVKAKKEPVAQSQQKTETDSLHTMH